MSPDGPIYQAEPLRCSACEVRESTARNFVDNDGSPHGLYVAVTAKEDDHG